LIGKRKKLSIFLKEIFISLPISDVSTNEVPIETNLLAVTWVLPIFIVELRRPHSEFKLDWRASPTQGSTFKLA